MQTDKYVYNAWGKVVSSSGSTVNPYKYVGQLGYYSDASTSLMLLGVRFYDPEAGVFTQRDPAKQGKSYYKYTAGHPLTGVDPTGMIWCTGTRWNTRCHFGNLPQGTNGWQVPEKDIQEWYEYILRANAALPPCRRLNIPTLEYYWGLISVGDIVANAKNMVDVLGTCNRVWLNVFVGNDDEDNAIWKKTLWRCRGRNHPSGPPHYGAPFNCADNPTDFALVCSHYVFGCDAAETINEMIGLIPYMNKPWWVWW